jgi:hypothetical protein
MTFLADQERQSAPVTPDPVPDRTPRRFVSRLEAVAAAFVIGLLAGFIFHQRFGNAGAGLANPGAPQDAFPDVTGMLTCVSRVSPTQGWTLKQSTRTYTGSATS